MWGFWLFSGERTKQFIDAIVSSVSLNISLSFAFCLDYLRSGDLSSSSSSITAADKNSTSISSQETFIISEDFHHTITTFKRYNRAIFDASTVLQPLSNENINKEVQPLLYDATRSQIWTEFEKGRSGPQAIDAWLERQAAKYPQELLEELKRSLFQKRQLSEDFINFVKSLSQHIHIHLLGNLAPPVWFSLQTTLVQGLQNPIESHISCEVGSRLPYPTIFESAVNNFGKNKEDLSSIVFVTASVDAHISARAMGFSTLLVDPSKSLSAQIRPVVHDPLPAARSWLEQRAGHLSLRTSIMTDLIRDTYIQLLILELTGDLTLLYPELTDPAAKTLRFSWFVGPRPASIWDFPPDLDCTSLAYLYLPRLTSPDGRANANKTMDEILQYKVEETGLLNTYLDHEKIRLDLVALANVLSLFYAYGRGKDVAITEDFLFSVLRNGAYEAGSHYYTNSNVFLFAISRVLVLQIVPSPTAPPSDLVQHDRPNILDPIYDCDSSVEYELETLKAKLSPVLRACVQTQIHRPTDALGLACLLIAGARCGLRLDTSLNSLVELQQSDGSWPECVIYKFNRRDGVCWHQGLTTALAVKAIEEWNCLKEQYSDLRIKVVA